MRKLRIGQISPLNLPVPPQKYGGTEEIIYLLCEELHKRGHKVFLFASKDSKVSCKTIPIVEKALWRAKPKETIPYYAYQMSVIAQKIKELKIDILHDHLGPWALSLYGQTKVPIVHTLHVPFKNKDRIWAYKKAKAKLISISFSQRKPAPKLNYIGNVYNGIDLNIFSFSKKAEDFLLWVGELSPRKGILEAIQIAKLSKEKLRLIGRIPPPQQKNDYVFFKKHIEKELNKNNIEYLGEMSRKKVAHYYKKAKAFIFPIQWEEPFGLVMTEAMACGTPVIAFKRGSVPEIVKHGKTGFVVKDIKEALKAIKQINQIDRLECRKWVEKNFSAEKMVDEYERIYYKMIEKAK